MRDHSIEISEHAGVRYLHFSAEWIQGAMRIQRPNALELAYTREMMAGLLLREPPWPKNVLLIGLGAGSLAKFAGIFALTQIPLAISEGLLTVLVVNALHRYHPDELSQMRLFPATGGRA